MIDSVRSTVLSIISKDNRGYITPFEFNLFAKQAQLEIFEGLFYTYSNSVNKQNAHLHNNGYTDIPKQIEEAIDSFSAYGILDYNAVNGKYKVPEDSYTLNTVIYNGTTEIEKVPSTKIYNLLSSNLTSPTTSYPVYTQEGVWPPVQTLTTFGDYITVYPNTIAQTGLVTAQYVRFPRDPKWTYNGIVNGTPVFDPTQPDYQDFELPLSYETDLVIKILQYAGLSIRENDITSAAKAEEGQNAQKV